MIEKFWLALAGFLGIHDKPLKSEDRAYHIFVDASHQEKSAFWLDMAKKANEDQRKIVEAADKMHKA